MTQATLGRFELHADGDIGAWRLATDEPGFYGLRRYWRTDEYVLVANQSTNSYSVYDAATWESGILGRENDPLVERSDCEDAFATALEWMDEHRDGDLDGNGAMSTDRCNVCVEPREGHTLVVEIEEVLGAAVWVYDDGFAAVVPWLLPKDRLAEVDGR